MNTANSEKIKLEANESLARYRAEVRKKRLIDFSLYISISVFVVFFIMLAAGDRFRTTLAFFGLEPWYYSKGGVFADCSDPANRDNEFCWRQRQEREGQWRKINKGAIPFSLSGKER